MEILAKPEKVKKIISAIGADDKKGSRELAMMALKAFVFAVPADGISKDRYRRKILSIADEISRVRPAMVVIANVAWKIREKFVTETKGIELPEECYKVLRDLVKNEERQIRSLEETVAKHFTDHFSKLRKPLIFSYSSTLVSVIRKVGKNFTVFACESRPALEGRKTARLLVGSVVSVRLITEAQIPMAVEKCDSVLIGCDCIFSDGSVVNKMGSKLLSIGAHILKRPVIVLGDTYKLSSRVKRVSEEHPISEIWKNPPHGIAIINEYFERIPPGMIDYVVTERGVFKAGKLRRLVKPSREKKRK